jgi:hypothetical protein
MGFLILSFQVSNIISVFLALEILYVGLILYLSFSGRRIFFIWALILVVGGAVVGLSIVVSVVSIFGGDSQSSFLD